MTDTLLADARDAVAAAPPIGDPAYARYCHALAVRLAQHWPRILEANAEDVERALGSGLPAALVDRLRLDTGHLDRLAGLTDAVLGELGPLTARDPGVPVPGGGVRRRVPKPLGVLLMVYEARPTVTVEGALLPVVVGNAVLLRGGKEIARTNAALAGAVREALAAVGLPAGLVTLLDDPDRSRLRALLKRPDAVDVVVPRGSPSLVDFCRTGSIPVIASGGGVNHLYVHRDADLGLAARIAVDSKVPEPTACNTAELILVDAEVAEGFVAVLLRAVEEDGRGLAVRLDPRIPAPAYADGTAGPYRTEPLQPYDLGREFLDATLGVRPVAGPAEALGHIRRYGSAHTEGIVARAPDVIEEFTRRVDAAAIVVNGSLRLHDGPVLGLGSEIAISTGRLHTRGPVTLGSLVTHSWIVEADGALRDSVPADRSRHHVPWRSP